MVLAALVRFLRPETLIKASTHLNRGLASSLLILKEAERLLEAWLSAIRKDRGRARPGKAGGQVAAVAGRTDPAGGRVVKGSREPGAALVKAVAPCCVQACDSPACVHPVTKRRWSCTSTRNGVCLCAAGTPRCASSSQGAFCFHVCHCRISLCLSWLQRGAVQGLLASSLAWPQARRATRAVGDERGVSTVTLHTGSFLLGALAPGITLSS